MTDWTEWPPKNWQEMLAMQRVELIEPTGRFPTVRYTGSTNALVPMMLQAAEMAAVEIETVDAEALGDLPDAVLKQFCLRAVLICVGASYAKGTVTDVTVGTDADGELTSHEARELDYPTGRVIDTLTEEQIAEALERIDRVNPGVRDVILEIHTAEPDSQRPGEWATKLALQQLLAP